MKKSLIALAVLASTGAAMAQSSVTLYGRIDASVGKEETGVGAAKTSKTQMFDNNFTTSRWGMRGTEDLGGALKASFQFETEIKPTTGASTGFNRASWVGLSGGFGGVKAGKTDSVYKDIFDSGVANSLFDSEFTPYKIAYTGVSNYISRPNNQIRYDSPNFSGLTAGVTYGFEDSTVAAGTPQTTALSLRYRTGPMDFGFANQKQDYKPATPLVAGTPGDRTYNVFSASYNFGMAKVSAQFQNAKQSGGGKDTEYNLGVAVPLGAFELSAGYANGTAKNNAGATIGKGKAYAFGATYTLSKRTRLYGGYLTGDVKNAAGTKTADRTMYAVGVRHDF
ncbi:MAG: porin [Burkholderiaceae bacterium]|nr:porin [Burkholderiaceae bacterium]